MSALREEPLLCVRMSFEEYLQLPEQPRAESVDGVAVIMNAPPVFDHGQAAVQLAVVLARRLPQHDVAVEVLTRLSEDRVRLPDVTVTASRRDDGWLTEPRSWWLRC